MKAFRIKSKKIKKLPASITLPRDFIRMNILKAGDSVEIFILETGDLVIKKMEVKR